LKNKIIIGFSLFGFFISLMGGIIAGNKPLHIALLSLISTGIFGALVFGLFAFLDQKVPEFMDFINNLGNSEYEPQESAQETKMNEDNSNQASFDAGDSNSIGSSDSMEDAETIKPSPSKGKDTKFGDHIMVDNIALKNEPKLMAEAIRTIMAQDDGMMDSKK
jgi:hypothetical protein